MSDLIGFVSISVVFLNKKGSICLYLLVFCFCLLVFKGKKRLFGAAFKQIVHVLVEVYRVLPPEHYEK